MLTKEQFIELRNKGLSVDQIVNFEKGNKPQIQEEKPKKTLIEKIGSLAGLDVIGKKIAGFVAPKLVSKELQPYVSEIVKKEEPTALQTLGGVGKLALTVGTLGTGGIASSLTGRVIEGGIIGGAFTALDNLANKEKITKNLATGVAIGGAIPLAGAAIKKGIQKLGGGMIKTSEKIESSLIRPTKADVADGFNIANIKKYNLGGNLQTTLKKTDATLAELTTQLKTKLASRPGAVVDLNEVAKRTAENVLKDKGRYFGDTTGVKRILQRLSEEIENVSGNGLVDLPEAQIIKQAAGQKGAWVYGFLDPDAKATELIYTRFYQQLKKEIEKVAPQGVKEINKQISELIPISHAVIRRIPVAERNNVFSLTDIISGGLSFGNPQAVSLFIANRLTKSGEFAKLLGKTGEKLQQVKLPSGNIGGRIFGR